MKIQICGFSASGKSTFAKLLSKYYKIPVLHLDTLHFGNNWEIIPDSIMSQKVDAFLKNNDEWILDGNYLNVSPSRIEQCEKIYYFEFNRFVCIRNAYRRYHEYKNKKRDDMAFGCDETLDMEFITWILFRSRTKKGKADLELLKQLYVDKIIIFHNHKEVNKYLENLTKK